MFAYAARRLGGAVVIVLLASALLFVMVRTTTDPLAHVRAATATGDPNASANLRLISEESRRLGIDQPFVTQYGKWLARFARGDWGRSIVSGRSVGAEIRGRLWNTVQLTVWGIGFALAVSIVIGVVSARRKYSVIDHGLSGLSFVALSMPSFWFALLAIELLVFRPRSAFHLDQPLLYSVGLHSANGGGMLDYGRHLVLPVLTLSLPLAAAWSRYLRASMIDVLSAPYIRAARGRGVSERRVLFDHALRNALVPFTTVSAVGIGHLFAGLIVTETIFAWPGMGQLLYNALLAGDTNVLLPWLVVAASFVLVLNLVADLAHGVLDPRVRVV